MIREFGYCFHNRFIAYFSRITSSKHYAHHVDTWKSTKHILYFFDQTTRLLFILLLVLCGYYSRVAAIQGWHSFPWKPRDINDSWIRYVQVRRWRLLDTVSSILSVLLSAVGTTHTTLALVWWSSSEIIHTRLLAMATIQRRCLFRSRASDCAATIWGWLLFEEIQYEV